MSKQLILEPYVPACTDKDGSILPVMYYGNPTTYCPYDVNCSYRKENDLETRRICTYYGTMSLIMDKQMFFDY